MARLSHAAKVRNLNKVIREQSEQIERLHALDHDSHNRAIEADENAARAIRERDNLREDLKKQRALIQDMVTELATLRGYVQRVNQSDNAHRSPIEITHSDGTKEFRPFYELPRVGRYDPSGTNDDLMYRSVTRRVQGSY